MKGVISAANPRHNRSGTRSCGAMTEYHRQFFALVDGIERRFPVVDWRVGDVPVWPLARATLYSNICEELLGAGGAEGHARRQKLKFLSAWRVRLLMRQRRSPTPGEAGRTFGTPSFGLIAPTSCFSVTEYRSIRWTGRGEIVSAIR
jgi:hypothetical protein